MALALIRCCLRRLADAVAWNFFVAGRPRDLAFGVADAFAFAFAPGFLPRFFPIASPCVENTGGSMFLTSSLTC